MKGLKYQLKNVLRDKLSILSFLLPIIAGLAIQLFSGVNFSALGETSFCVVENELSHDAVEWLQTNGNIRVVPDLAALKSMVNDPKTQVIGVISHNEGIKALLSGDELQVTTVIGNTLPKLYAEKNNATFANITVIPAADNNDAFMSLLTVITMVTAMFMGCTFNAMNMIGEKEDGIAFVNAVLPMTKRDYIIQKISLGFAGGVLSTVLTAFVCIKIRASQILLLLLLIILSAFIAALVGLFIGRFSSGLMAGIMCIKITMIVFLALPILIYLLVPSSSMLYALSYFLPSSATFYGLMDLLGGQVRGIWTDILVLFVHCIVWLVVILATKRNNLVNQS